MEDSNRLRNAVKLQLHNLKIVVIGAFLCKVENVVRYWITHLSNALHCFAKEPGSSGGREEGAMTSLHLRVLDHPFDLNFDPIAVASAISIGQGCGVRL